MRPDLMATIAPIIPKSEYNYCASIGEEADIDIGNVDLISQTDAVSEDAEFFANQRLYFESLKTPLKDVL